MSYSALQAPGDIFGVNSALRQRAFPLGGDHRRDSDSHSPTMSEPRSPLFRPSLTAEFPSHLASLYNSPYAAAAVAAAVAGQGAAGVGAPPTFNPYGRPACAAAFYPGMVGGDAWRRSPYLSQLDFWPPGLREAVVGPRTKAPREATTILKSWLNEHKDNPYPTKSEKMTLSLVTHMTLTQVSTWFANARRRIKKENKMTWTPKTRCGERDGNSSNEEENERDYFGRQRSPFAMSRDMGGGDTTVKRTSGDYDSNKNLTPFERSAPSSSVPFSTNLTRKGPTHPLFAAFSGLQSPYKGLKAPGIEDVFRQKIIPTIDDKSEDKKVPGCLESERTSSPTFSNEHTQTYDPERPAPQALSTRPSYPIIADNASLGQSHAPFVNLKKRKPFSESDCDGIDLTDGDNKDHSADERLVAKRDEASVSESLRATSKVEVSKSEDKSSANESNRHKSEGVWPSLQENTAPNLHRPFFVNEMVTKSATNGKMDPLSCWIRDFQHLVASGQEIKAKQALATALAVAAKAGAYSGMGGVQRPAPYFIPRRQSHAERRSSSDGSQNEDSQDDKRLMSISSNRPSGMSFGSGSQCESRANSDFKGSSPEVVRQRTPSPGSPPASAVRLRSPYKGALAVADESPMNLSQPFRGKKDWIPNEANVVDENGETCLAKR